MLIQGAVRHVISTLHYNRPLDLSSNIDFICGECVSAKWRHLLLYSISKMSWIKAFEGNFFVMNRESVYF
jgi:hypothetical protein